MAVLDSSDIKLINLNNSIRNNALSSATNAIASGVDLGWRFPTTSGVGGGGTGVYTQQLDPYMARIRSLQDRGVGGAGQLDTDKWWGDVQLPITAGGGYGGIASSGVNWDEVLGEYNKPFGELRDRLAELVGSERTNIQNAASRAADFYSTIDPQAGYRPTYTTFQAPQAAMQNYLQAIGANPEQVNAQRDLMNQLMAAQALNQTQYGSAVDQAQNNFRLQQLAEVYANQQLASGALSNTATQQNIQMELARIAAINAVRKMQFEQINEENRARREYSRDMSRLNAEMQLAQMRG